MQEIIDSVASVKLGYPICNILENVARIKNIIVDSFKKFVLTSERKLGAYTNYYEHNIQESIFDELSQINLPNDSTCQRVKKFKHLFLLLIENKIDIITHVLFSEEQNSQEMVHQIDQIFEFVTLKIIVDFFNLDCANILMISNKMDNYINCGPESPTANTNESESELEAHREWKRAQNDRRYNERDDYTEQEPDYGDACEFDCEPAVKVCGLTVRSPSGSIINPNFTRWRNVDPHDKSPMMIETVNINIDKYILYNIFSDPTNLDHDFLKGMIKKMSGWSIDKPILDLVQAREDNGGLCELLLIKNVTLLRYTPVEFLTADFFIKYVEDFCARHGNTNFVNRLLQVWPQKLNSNSYFKILEMFNYDCKIDMPKKYINSEYILRISCANVTNKTASAMLDNIEEYIDDPNVVNKILLCAHPRRNIEYKMLTTMKKMLTISTNITTINILNDYLSTHTMITKCHHNLFEEINFNNLNNMHVCEMDIDKIPANIFSGPGIKIVNVDSYSGEFCYECVATLLLKFEMMCGQVDCFYTHTCEALKFFFSYCKNRKDNYKHVLNCISNAVVKMNNYKIYEYLISENMVSAHILNNMPPTLVTNGIFDSYLKDKANKIYIINTFYEKNGYKNLCFHDLYLKYLTGHDISSIPKNFHEKSKLYLALVALKNNNLFYIPLADITVELVDAYLRLYAKSYQNTNVPTQMAKNILLKLAKNAELRKDHIGDLATKETMEYICGEIFLVNPKYAHIFPRYCLTKEYKDVIKGSTKSARNI